MLPCSHALSSSHSDFDSANTSPQFILSVFLIYDLYYLALYPNHDSYLPPYTYVFYPILPISITLLALSIYTKSTTIFLTPLPYSSPIINDQYTLYVNNYTPQNRTSLPFPTLHLNLSTHYSTYIMLNSIAAISLYYSPNSTLSYIHLSYKILYQRATLYTPYLTPPHSD